MKIQLISDTHGFDYNIAEEADVIVHAGDFSNSVRGVVNFANICKKANKDFVFALGNHDFYTTDLNYTIDFIKTNYPNNALLFDNSITIKDKTFVGGTLFTNFRANVIEHTDPLQWSKNKNIAQGCVYDFVQIQYKGRLITADDYVTLFNLYYNNIMKYKNKKDVVVVTHYPPHLACLDPFWANHPSESGLNPYFINDLDVKGFDVWLSGHTHTAVDTVVDGCRLVVNPLGYRNEQALNGFRNNLIIEV